jgi:hypothetical protein
LAANAKVLERKDKKESKEGEVDYQSGRGLNTWLSGVIRAWSRSKTLRVKPGKSVDLIQKIVKL